MVIRKLLNYEWRYENGVVVLIDRKKGISFELPIFYVSSFIRAGLTFINVYRKEQFHKAQKRMAFMKLSQAKFRVRMAERQKKVQSILSKYDEAKKQREAQVKL